MPLIVIAGLPCSGKSTVAEAVAEACRALGQEVQVVDEESLHLRRNDSYKDATAEKQARGALLSAMDRVLTRRRTIVFDTQNNIKGYRYQLWCIARSVGTRFCMVHVDTPTETCRQWNTERDAERAYTEDIFEDLACRFERPDSRNRWDSPLFTLHPVLGAGHLQAQAAAVAAAVADTPTPQQRQQQQQQQQQAASQEAAAAGPVETNGCGAAVAAAVAGSGLDAAAEGAAEGEAAEGAAAGLPAVEPLLDEPQQVVRAKLLKPTITTDTNQSKLSATNLQHDIDRALQQVLESVAAAQAAAGSGAPGVVSFDHSSSSSASSNADGSGSGGAALPPLDMYRPMFLPELRRHKRAFMKLATNQTLGPRLRDATAAQRLFIGYLRDQLAAQQH